MVNFVGGSFTGVVGAEARPCWVDEGEFEKGAGRDSEYRQPLKEAWPEREGARRCGIKEVFGMFKLLLSK